MTFLYFSGPKNGKGYNRSYPIHIMQVAAVIGITIKIDGPTELLMIVLLSIT